jgi:hypothetical protein
MFGLLIFGRESDPGAPTINSSRKQGKDGGGRTVRRINVAERLFGQPADFLGMRDFLGKAVVLSCCCAGYQLHTWIPGINLICVISSKKACM